MFSFLFGRSRKIRRLRRKWDRLREKSLKKHEPVRSEALKRLDIVENNIRTLEEQKLNRVVGARLAKDSEISLAEISALLKISGSELLEYTTGNRQKRQ
ncbi:MAG: hypothetical protein ABIH90_00850 [Candidatus Aenigmatarchaeota archaeon]